MCVVPTSGSTGAPQHVVLLYAAWMHRFRWQASAYPLRPHHCLLVKTPPAFVDSVWEALMSAMCGACTSASRNPLVISRVGFQVLFGHRRVELLCYVNETPWHGMDGLLR